MNNPIPILPSGGNARTIELRQNAEAAIRNLFEHTAYCPEAGDDLLAVTLFCCEQLGIFVADWPDALEFWEQTHDHLPTIATRDTSSLSTGHDILHRKLGDEKKLKRKPKLFSSKPIFTASHILKTILKLHISAELKRSKRTGTPPLRNVGEWASLLAHRIKQNDPQALIKPEAYDIDIPAASLRPGLFYPLIQAKIRSHTSRQGKLDEFAAFTQVVRDKVKQILTEFNRNTPSLKEEAG